MERNSARDRERYRKTEKRTEISYEHNNISENLTIFNYLNVAWHANVTFDRVVFEARDASLIYRGYPKTSA